MSQSLAFIHPDAKVSPGATVEPFAFVDKNVEIGEGSWIGPHAVLMEGTRIGKNCKIFSGAVIASIPQDLKFQGEETTVEIGDNTVVRECVTISRGTKAKYKTVVGKNCLIMAYVHLAHDCHVGDHCILVNAVQIAGHVNIGEWAIVGGSSSVHQYVRIGSHVMIAGGSLVRKDVPPFTKAAREPLSFSGINSIGLRRRGYGNDKINEIQEIYRIVYLRGLNNTKALEAVHLEISPSPEREEIVKFIRESERGIMKGYNHI
jgi:UDP-N-acetylglucosamine acyltransferase